MSLNGQHVIVVGGTSGIGFAVAAQAAAEGASVTVASRSQDGVTAAAKLLPGDAFGVQLDVTDEAAVRTFFEAQGRFDHLVYTAGEALLLGPLAALSPEQGF